MESKAQGSEVREDFLRQFVYNLMINSLNLKLGFQFIDKKVDELEIINGTQTVSPLSEHSLNVIKTVNSSIVNIKESAQTPPKKSSPLPQPLNKIIVPMSRAARPVQTIRKFNNPSTALAAKTQSSQKMPMPAPLQNIPLSPSTQATNSINIAAMDKINPLLLDPSVQIIECPSPERPLLVNRGGLVQATNIVLSAEEIDSLLKEISQDTKIPLIPGVFKAAINNFIITAVISEFVGTRFIIQKKSPFQ